MTMQSIGLPIACMFTLGNQANTSISDIINAVLDDECVCSIGLHMECVRDIEAFDITWLRALEKKRDTKILTRKDTVKIRIQNLSCGLDLKAIL